MAGEINLASHIQLATQRLRLRPGDVRLIGWTDYEPPGLTLSPTAAQTTIRTLVLCHLRRGAIPAARPDVNCKEEIKDEKPADDEKPAEGDEKSPEAINTKTPN